MLKKYDLLHGNGEDLGTSQSFMLKLSESLNCNVYAIEYPNYGSYIQLDSQNQSKIVQIKLDAECLYNFLINDKNILPENLSVFGRSIGTGPACYLAKNFQFEYVVLMSSYTKLKELIPFLLNLFLNEDFDNEQCLSQSQQKNPILFIHGENDTLIKPKYSQQLYEIAKKQNKKSKIKIQSDMTHNDFDFLQDIVKAIKEFVENLKSESESDSSEDKPNNTQICGIQQNNNQTFNLFQLGFEI